MDKRAKYQIEWDFLGPAVAEKVKEALTRKPLGVEALCKIADALGVEYPWLVGKNKEKRK